MKQLKPAVLGDETELHGFIAETDGAPAHAAAMMPLANKASGASDMQQAAGAGVIV